MREKRFRILDTATDQDVLGEYTFPYDNPFVSLYGVPLRGNRHPRDLAIGESCLQQYAVSGQAPGVYKILRVE